MTEQELQAWEDYYAALGTWLAEAKEGSNPGGPPPSPTPPGGEA